MHENKTRIRTKVVLLCVKSYVLFSCFYVYWRMRGKGLQRRKGLRIFKGTTQQLAGGGTPPSRPPEIWSLIRDGGPPFSGAAEGLPQVYRLAPGFGGSGGRSPPAKFRGAWGAEPPSQLLCCTLKNPEAVSPLEPLSPYSQIMLWHAVYPGHSAACPGHSAACPGHSRLSRRAGVVAPAETFEQKSSEKCEWILKYF